MNFHLFLFSELSMKKDHSIFPIFSNNYDNDKKLKLTSSAPSSCLPQMFR